MDIDSIVGVHGAAKDGRNSAVIDDDRYSLDLQCAISHLQRFSR